MRWLCCGQFTASWLCWVKFNAHIMGMFCIVKWLINSYSVKKNRKKRLLKKEEEEDKNDNINTHKGKGYCEVHRILWWLARCDSAYMYVHYSINPCACSLAGCCLCLLFSALVFVAGRGVLQSRQSLSLQKVRTLLMFMLPPFCVCERLKVQALGDKRDWDKSVNKSGLLCFQFFSCGLQHSCCFVCLYLTSLVGYHLLWN